MSNQLEYAMRLERMRKHHRHWLHLCFGRDCITLELIGQHGDKYHEYAMHHMNYDGDALWWQILPVSRSTHMDLLHGDLSHGLPAGEQRRVTGVYPNTPQKLVHAWGRLILLSFLVCHLLWWLWRVKWVLLSLGTIVGYFVLVYK